MARMQLDFVATRRHFSVFGLLLLTAGLACLLLASWRMSQTQQVQQQLEGQLWQLQAPPASPETDTEATALVAADRLARQFRRPWTMLFQRLEQINVPGVRLGQILPQAGDKASVQLGGEASDAESLYEYLRALRRQGGVTDVYLLQQHWDAESEALRFVVQARWDAGQEPVGAP
ncbi:hypothetical protein [Chitinimonas sp. JJ19]|uniref:hypothetical protein n=1 Tax=Chitinimonas sp. JJ19 TaxID=3109352 RepID=UPI0030034352